MSNDLRAIGQKALAQNASPMLKAFAAFNSAVMESESEIPRKYKELIAIGVGLTTQCQDCITGHTAAAITAGATPEELAETVHIAAALRAGGAMVHGMKYVMPASVEAASHSNH
jgi:AhpD family alkylhydroperoxidase